MSCGSKYICAPCSQDELSYVLILIMTIDTWKIVGLLKIQKTWISWERNITFPQNKKILNLCFRQLILRCYHFVAEVTFEMFIGTEFSVVALWLFIIWDLSWHLPNCSLHRSYCDFHVNEVQKTRWTEFLYERVIFCFSFAMDVLWNFLILWIFFSIQNLNSLWRIRWYWDQNYQW